MGKHLVKVARGIGFFVFIVPLTLIWILVQIPFSLVEAAGKRQRDKRFAAAMRAAGRMVSWADARAQVDAQRGTLVEEFVSAGGYRLWWTPEYIPDMCPYLCRFKSDEEAAAEHADLLLRDGHSERVKQLRAAVASEYATFFEWCRSRYTNPESGTALLVDIAQLDQKEWMHYFGVGSPAGQRFIHIQTN